LRVLQKFNAKTLAAQRIIKKLCAASVFALNSRSEN